MTILWLALSAAPAADLRVCTDLGGIVGAVADDGSVSGHLGRWAVKGTEATLQVVEPGGTIRYEGPLAALNPRPVPDLIGADEFGARVIAAYDVVSEPLACPLAGPATIRVGRWPDPIALPADHWVASVGDVDALVRSPTGVAWLRDVAMGPAMAADVAAELGELLPEHRSTVQAKGGRALVITQLGTTIEAGGIAAVADAELSVLPLLRPPRALVAPERIPRVVPAAAGGTLEMLVEVNGFRREAGLPAYDVSASMNWAALSHCVYLDWAASAGRARGHWQEPDSPVFFGATPGERQGASEVVAHQPDLLPWESVTSWIAAPFHRSPLLDPRPGGVGACATTGGARVMEVEHLGARPQAPFAWPTDGQGGVPLQFDGREQPEPIPVERHPDRVAPMGLPLTVWLPWKPAMVDEVKGWLSGPDGEVPMWLVAPATHEALAEAPRAEVHLVPKRPLAAGTAYTWGVSWRATVPAAKRNKAPTVTLGEWKGSFTTEAAVTPPAPPTLGAAEKLARAIDARRAEKGLPGLAVDHDATVAAAMVRDGAAESAGSILQAEVWSWACFSAAQIARLGDGAVPEGLLDAQLTRAGFRDGQGRTCVVAAAANLRPPAWDPRERR